MTRPEFISAISKGQGRAIAAIRNGEFTPSLHDLKRTVLRWPGYDSQCETSRGWYCTELIKSSSHETELTELVLRHVARTKGSWRHRSHKDAITFEFAKRGEHKAREALYAYFDPANDFRFAEEILEIDGFAGLSWLIPRLMVRLLPDEFWRCGLLASYAGELLGEQVVSDWLETESSTRPEVAEFARLAAEKPKQSPRPDGRSIANLSFAAIRELWFGPGVSRSAVWQWAAKAPKNEVTMAWRAFEIEGERTWLHVLSRALRRKAQYARVETIIKRARTWNDDSNPFAEALEEVVDPRVRQLGFELIADGWIADGMALVATNAMSGDEGPMLAALNSLSDADNVHHAGCDILRIENGIDKRDLLLWIYEHGPCSFCRESAVNDLIQAGQAPDWLLKECLLDCVSDTRELATTALLLS